MRAISAVAELRLTLKGGLLYNSNGKLDQRGPKAAVTARNDCCYDSLNRRPSLQGRL